MGRRLQFTILSVIFFALTSLSVNAQVEVFSGDPVKFIDEVRQSLIQGDRVNGKKLGDRLEDEWKDKKIPEDRIRVMIATLNEMQKKRYRAYPHFAPYIEAVLASVKSKRDDAEFNKWDESVRYVMKKRASSAFVDYLENSKNLIEQNIVYKSSSLQWISRFADWKLQFTEGSEPVIFFPRTDLLVLSKGDSSVIYGTSGILQITEGKWVGKSGRIFWDRANLAHDKVNADLKNYQIDLKSPRFVADSVMFTHKDYFDKPVLGNLEEKVLSDQTAENTNYPKFTSYEKRILLKDFVKDVDYEGGFAFRGAKFIGSGDPEFPAYLKFYRNGEVFLRAASLNYTFRENQILTDRAQITIYVKKNSKIDSIYHPGLQFKYLTDKRELSLIRIGDGLVQSMYNDSYHDVDMDVEAMYWKIDEPKIELSGSRGTTEPKANIFSRFYFRDIMYERQGNPAGSHPLVLIRQYLDAKKTKSFTGKDMATFFRDDPTHVRQILMRLSIIGLLNYNVDKDIAVVNERFFQFVDAKNRKQDYDVIEFNSVTGRGMENGVLSLFDYNIRLKGVDKVALSDSQSVYVFPKKAELTMKEGMDFSFDGRIAAGRFTLFGNKFDFFYNKFNLDLANVDSVRIRVPSKTVDENGQKPLKTVKTVIEGLSALLEIDAPTNKSGLKSIPKYPIFTSRKNSFTYYQRPSIQGGVYKRDNFYFQLDPFVIDSLDVFDTQKMALDGSFVSAGIFPEFREKLVIMDDYSLGFSRDAGPNGMPVYNGAGNYKKEIKLSHDGLRGNGTLDYLASNAISNDFKFYPDSMNTIAQKFTVKKTKTGVQYPDVKASDVYIHWVPKKDIFNVGVTDKNKPIEMYNEESKLNGSINLTAKGMTGKGTLTMLNAADLSSKNFNFLSENVKADTSKFALKALNLSGTDDTMGVSLLVDNINADVSFKDREGKFVSNSGTSATIFPYNKYKAYMEELNWFMDKGEVDMNTKRLAEIGLRGALFVSTKADQDSLNFVSPKARYVESEKTIYAGEVAFIDVADARIIPVDQKLIIRKDAYMEPLKDAKIELPAGKPNYIINPADVSINGRFKLNGKGKFEYKDENGKPFVVNIFDINVDTAKSVYAKGKIEETEKFQLNPMLDFKGDVLINSSNPQIKFNGFCRLNHTCTSMKKSWMRFDSRIDPKEIYIPVTDDPRDEAKTQLFNGFAFASDSSGIYPVMFSQKTLPSDYEVIKVTGYMFYNKTKNEYQISSMEKLKDQSLIGNYMTFNAGDCSAYAEGKIELGGNLGQVSTITTGTITYSPKTEETNLNVLLGIRFSLDNDLWSFISNKIAAGGLTETIDLKTEQIDKGLFNIMDNKKANKLKDDINSGDVKRIPDELEQSFVFTGVNLIWNKKKKSLTHEGRVGLFVMNGKVVNRMVNAKIEIDRRRGGDAVHIYLDINDNYFYFYYKNNMMSIVSSYDEYNKKIMEMDPKKRTVEGKDGKPNYSFVLGTQRKAVQFSESFKE
jgi:hypothetical protein